MIELRYVHVEGSDHQSLQYRYQYKPLKFSETADRIHTEWSNWKFVGGIVVSMEEYEKMQKESIGND